MGAIRKAIDAINPVADQRKEIEQQLDTLAELAETKANLFDATLRDDILNAGTDANRSVPVASIIGHNKWTHAYHATHADKITSEVTDSLNMLITGEKNKSFDAVKQLLSTAMTAFLGEGQGSDFKQYSYYVLSIGQSLLRVDTYAWSRDVTAAALTSVVQKVAAFVGYTSVVDMGKLPFSTFYFYYSQQLNAGGLPAEQVERELERVRRLYILHNHPVRDEPVKPMELAPGKAILLD